MLDSGLLFDYTHIIRDAKIFIANGNGKQDIKKHNLWYIAYIPFFMLMAFEEQKRIEYNQDDYAHYQHFKSRFKRYKAAGYKYITKQTRINATKVQRREKEYIRELRKIFLDAPASALHFIGQNQEQEAFLEIAKYDNSVVKLLKNFNKVISAPEGTFGEDTLRKLASVSTEKFYERLAEYADVRLGLKQAMNKSFKTQTERKVERVVKREDKRQEKQTDNK
jgi:hypothetical protein